MASNSTSLKATGQHSGKLSFVEKLSYGQLDTAGQLVFCVISNYLLYFYTDVAKLPVATAGVILLVARVFDAIDAPIWGTLIDLTNTKWGRARPYFLWLAVPFTVFGIMTFWAPQVSLHSKVIYCAITYIVTGILYTGLNTPLTAILPLLTADPDERLRLNSWRMTGGQIGVLVVNACTLPLVAFLGSGNDVNGFRYTIIIFALVGCFLTLFSFKHLRERVHVTAKKTTLKQGFHAMKNNWPWLIIVISNFFYWVALTERNSTLVYYFTYNFHNKGLVTLFNTMSSIQILSMISIPFLNRFMSKHTLWIGALVVSIVGQLIITFGGINVGIAMTGWIIGNFGAGIACAMPNALLGTAVDYGKMKNGVNAAGLLTAFGSTFCIKLGSGIAGFIPSMILAGFGYVAGQTQTAHALTGISISFNWITVIAFAIAAIPLFFYKKYEAMEDEIREAVANEE